MTRVKELKVITRGFALCSVLLDLSLECIKFLIFLLEIVDKSVSFIT